MLAISIWNGRLSAEVRVSSHWLCEQDPMRLTPQAWIVRFHKDWTTVEKLVATLQRLLLQPLHGFERIKREMGRQKNVRQ